MNETDLIKICFNDREVFYKEVTPITITEKFAVAVSIPLSLFAVFSNALILIVLATKKRLQTPSNVLTGALCASDLSVGLMVLPLFIAKNLTKVSNVQYCKLQLTHIYAVLFCWIVSLVSISFISLDRYYAVCHPFRYYGRNLKLPYLIAVIVAWISSIAFTVVRFTWSETYKVSTVVLGFLCMVTFLITAVSNIKIFQAIRKTRSNIVLPSFAGSNRRVFWGREKRKSMTVIIIIAVYVMCFIPSGIFMVISRFGDLPWIMNHVVGPVVQIITYTNSCINPLLYCIRITEIRQAVFAVLRVRSPRAQEVRSNIPCVPQTVKETMM